MNSCRLSVKTNQSGSKINTRIDTQRRARHEGTTTLAPTSSKHLGPFAIHSLFDVPYTFPLNLEKRPPLKHLSRCCALVLFFVSFQQTFSQTTEKIPAQQLLAWAIGGMTEEHLLAQIKQRGVLSYDDELLKALHSAGAADSAIAELKKTKPSPKSLGTDEGLTSLLKVASAIGSENYEGAYKQLMGSVQANPKNADLHFAAAGILRKVETWELAVGEYRLATQLAPELLDAQQGLAFTYYRMAAPRLCNRNQCVSSRAPCFWREGSCA
ncbi:MAG: hypothetical protein JWO13_65 [Acidobacteriales bacterium]|nr:hypothetical protein [Terriglobales bacterium]